MTPPPTSQDRAETEGPWTTRRLMAWMSKAMAEKGVDSPRLCAEMLLSHVLGCDRIRLYAEADRPSSAHERDTLRALAARALKHEPVQYLVGEGWFFGLAFKCDRRALIPRPSTEPIVETILQHARSANRPLRLADVCTGTGCIAVALARHLPESRVIATDLSPEALALADENAQRHGVADRLELRRGDLLEPLTGEAEPLDYLASNPPYIPDHEWGSVEPNVKDYEPESALRGGADGLRFVAPLIECAPALVRPGGLLLIEIASCTAERVLELSKAHPLLRDPKILKDLDGLARVLVAERGRG